MSNRCQTWLVNEAVISYIVAFAGMEDKYETHLSRQACKAKSKTHKQDSWYRDIHGIRDSGHEWVHSNTASPSQTSPKSTYKCDKSATDYLT